MIGGAAFVDLGHWHFVGRDRGMATGRVGARALFATHRTSVLARWTRVERGDAMDIRIPIEGAEWLRSSESA